MIIERAASAKVSKAGNIGDTFGFQMEDPTMIFKLLRERMYSNPRLSAIQEYMCNARDAHRAAGKDDIPIEVTFPTLDVSEIHIRDFGNGISHEDMDRIFTKYGASTKTGTNQFTGGYGLGCKTGFALGDSFGVVSITEIEGERWKREYVAYLDDTTAGSMSLLIEEKTEEDTGVTIKLPVDSSRVSDFHGYFERTARHWKIKPLCRGYSPDWQPLNFTVRGDKWAMQSGSGYNSTQLIILDEIEYKLRKDMLGDSEELTQAQQDMLNKPFVLYFDTGELIPTPNREDIAYNDESIYTILSRLELIHKEFSHMYEKNMVDLFEATMSHFERKKLYLSKRSEIERYHPELISKYKGKIIPDEIENAYGRFGVKTWKIDRNSSYRDYEDLTFKNCPVLPAIAVGTIPVRENTLYILDEAHSTKLPHRGRITGLYQELESDGVISKWNSKLLYVVRLPENPEKRKEFLSQYPFFLEMCNHKGLHEFPLVALAPAPKYVKRDLVAVRPYTDNGESLYDRFQIEWKNEKESSMDDYPRAAYVLLRNGQVWSFDGSVNPVKPQVKRTKKDDKGEKEDDFVPLEEDSYRRRKRSRGYDNPPTFRGEAPEYFGDSLEKVNEKILNFVRTHSKLPIVGIFEKNLTSAMCSPGYISLEEAARQIVERFKHKYRELMVGNTLRFYPESPEFIEYGSSSLTAFFGDFSPHMMPTKQLKEWKTFVDRYPNFYKDAEVIIRFSNLPKTQRLRNISTPLLVPIKVQPINNPKYKWLAASYYLIKAKAHSLSWLALLTGKRFEVK